MSTYSRPVVLAFSHDCDRWDARLNFSTVDTSPYGAADRVQGWGTIATYDGEEGFATMERIDLVDRLAAGEVVTLCDPCDLDAHCTLTPQ